ncbi:MAG: TerC family protein [Kistimonas sp.]|nr:TerC family protein [Kistimonas sp.]
MEWITSPQAWISLLTLTVLEIVLGIDNIIFINILTNRLPVNQRDQARKCGLIAAMITRLLLLLSLSWIMKLTAPLVPLPLIQKTLSGRDLILLGGGLFLLFKSTSEIHSFMEKEQEQVDEAAPGYTTGFALVLGQIAVLDIVFSLDSIITAVGMTAHLPVMIAAVILSVSVMLYAATPVAHFIADHPTLKMLALSFLMLIGLSLVTEALAFSIPKGYIYFAMAFSLAVEMLNIRKAKRQRRSDRQT